MKVVFIDIDGVLNSRAYDRVRTPGECYYLDESRLPLVKRILDETGAVLVLSSTWKEHWSADAAGCDATGRDLNKRFAAHGLSIYDKTPDLGERSEEIASWLKQNAPIESYVVLDDMLGGWGQLQNNVVQTSFTVGRGLEERHAQQAIAILNGKNEG